MLRFSSLWSKLDILPFRFLPLLQLGPQLAFRNDLFSDLVLASKVCIWVPERVLPAFKWSLLRNYGMLLELRHPRASGFPLFILWYAYHRPIWLKRFISYSTHLRANIRRRFQSFAPLWESSNLRHDVITTWLALLKNGVFREFLPNRILLSLFAWKGAINVLQITGHLPFLGQDLPWRVRILLAATIGSVFWPPGRKCCILFFNANLDWQWRQFAASHHLVP